MREAGLMARAEEIDLTNNDARLDVLLKHGPGGKVPMLVTDDGDALEQSCAELGARTDNGSYSVVIALGYANFRDPNDGWRDGRRHLAAVYDELMQRPTLAVTAPVF